MLRDGWGQSQEEGPREAAGSPPMERLLDRMTPRAAQPDFDSSPTLSTGLDWMTPKDPFG